MAIISVFRAKDKKGWTERNEKTSEKNRTLERMFPGSQIQWHWPFVSLLLYTTDQ